MNDQEKIEVEEIECTECNGLGWTTVKNPITGIGESASCKSCYGTGYITVDHDSDYDEDDFGIEAWML